MSKRKTAILRRKIAQLAAGIYSKNSSLSDAGKKDLAFISKHLRKALKAIQRNQSKSKRSVAHAPKKGSAQPRKKRAAGKPKNIPRPQERPQS
jgi:hypothetical protein